MSRCLHRSTCVLLETWFSDSIWHLSSKSEAYTSVKIDVWIFCRSYDVIWHWRNIFRRKDMAECNSWHALVHCFCWYDCFRSWKCYFIRGRWLTIWLSSAYWRSIKQPESVVSRNVCFCGLGRAQNQFSIAADQ